jgi:hypothetical protein
MATWLGTISTQFVRYMAPRSVGYAPVVSFNMFMSRYSTLWNAPTMEFNMVNKD